MDELLTAAQMRALEQAEIGAGRVSGLALMERAGRAVADTILDLQNGEASRERRALVLCGPGNNGGDGFVIARLLKARGWDVEAALFGMPEKCPRDARVNLDRWRALGPVTPLPFAEPPRPSSGSGVLVDALFGTGLTRPLGPELARGVLARLEGPEFARWLRVAVDIPSGLCADSGRVLQPPSGEAAAFRADVTVTFHARKLGHVLAEGPACCGRLRVADIGLRGAAAPKAEEVVRLVGPPPRAIAAKQAAQKYESGHALVLAGAAGHTGAARLAARGALRIGAGLVTLGAPRASHLEIACQITALMLREVEDAPALSALLEDRRFNALCLGPGLGLARARALVPAALAGRRATVLDADALTAFQDAPGALLSALHPACVLTPHGGEFRRLFPDIAERLAAPALSGPAFSKVDATRAAAARAGSVVLFKGPDTVIAAPSGACVVHASAYERAAPWLATAGSGDVLAGFITGLLARGVAPMQAAASAAWLHAEAARAFGPGLIAEDLPEALPSVLRALGADGCSACEGRAGR